MAKALWRTLAKTELEDIVVYIVVYIDVHERRPETALKIADEIHAKAREYVGHSQIGRRHPSFPEEWLYFVHKRWVVVYQEHVEGIEVLRVVDGSRDFDKLFRT